MQELHDVSKPFKYVVTCVIVQKNGAGFHIGHSAYWDMSNDNVCQVRERVILDRYIALKFVGRANRRREYTFWLIVLDQPSCTMSAFCCVCTGARCAAQSFPLGGLSRSRAVQCQLYGYDV